MEITTKIKISKPLLGDEEGIFVVSKDTWLKTYINKEYKITKEDILSKDFGSDSKKVEWRKTIRSNAKNDKFALVAKEGEKVVGFCTAEKGLNMNEIGAIYVLKSYQAKGIGKKLFSNCLKWLGNEKDISLKVASFNILAINFYEKFGFKIKGLIEFKKLPSGREFPLVKMIRSK